MTMNEKTKEELAKENQELRERLEESEEILRAIRHDMVDALVIAKPQGNKVYTLKGANRTYRILIETISEGTAILAADGTVLFCNSRFVEMLKASAFNITGSSMMNFVAPGEKRLFEAMLQKGVKGSTRGEISLLTKNGSIIPAYLSINSLQMENMEGACVIATDLTEQKRNEEIVAAGRLARAILEQAAQAIIVCDEDGRIIQTSRMAYDLCARNPIFHPFDEAFPLMLEGEDDGGNGDGGKPFSIASVLQGQRFSSAEAALVNYGTKHHLLLNAGPLFSVHDRPVGCVVTLTDITELRHAHEALRRARDELEMRVEERTAELVKINQELQDFAFIASHDLQEPLRKIQVFGERLKTKCGDSLDPEAQDYLERMRRAANRMGTFTEDLLKYSRVATRARPFTEVELGRVVQEVAADLEIRIEQTDARLEVGEMPVIEADPNQMHQLFQNLISNALKFHEKGKHPVIKIYGRLMNDQEAEGTREGWYQIFVEDNGIGFDEQYLDRIFIPFQRLHGRFEYEGTGMGLAICKKIVERHGGTLTARSTRGKGATFIATLPLKQSKGDVHDEQ